MALGLIAGDDTAASASSAPVPGAAGRTGQPGAPGGFAFDVGEWSVKHDVLTLAGQKRTRRYLLIGAARTPEGRCTLYLMPEHPAWSLCPGAIAQHGELYVEKN